MKPKPHLVRIISRLNTGGIELGAYNFAVRNREHFGEIHFWLVGANMGEPSFIEKCEKAGIQLHHSPKSAKGFSEFRKFLKENSIDIVHAHIGHPSGIYLRLARKENIPHRIASWHSVQKLPKGPLKKRAVLHMQRLVAKNSTATFAVSEEVAKSLSNVRLRDKCLVIYNGYDVSAPSAKPSTEVLKLMHVGRFHPLKNHPFLWKILGELDRPFQFTACGRHDHPSSLPSEQWLSTIQNKWAGKVGGEVVSLPGNCNDVKDQLDGAHALIFPSIHEGLGGALIEASAKGCVCFASDIPAHREIAEHLQNIHLISLSASETEWSQQISTADYSVDVNAAYQAYLNSPFTVKEMDAKLEVVY